ncbi:MAG: hypothetical protein EA363_05875 [Balneolaceae bacterium]|nr:MAG: hypothetical protein EA363_05875 [Balneolaceae bacterium]
MFKIFGFIRSHRMSMTIMIMLLCDGEPSWPFHFVTFSSSVYIISIYMDISQKNGLEPGV